MGETKRLLQGRFNEHRRPVNEAKVKSNPTSVSEHFPHSLSILTLTCT